MATPTGAKTGGKSKPMPKKQLQHFEKRLLEERKRVLKELGHHEDMMTQTSQDSDGDLSSYSFHMADQGTDAMEREKAFLFASQEGRFLWHIDQALRRIYPGQGVLRSGHLPPAFLTLRPWFRDRRMALRAAVPQNEDDICLHPPRSCPPRSMPLRGPRCRGHGAPSSWSAWSSRCV